MFRAKLTEDWWKGNQRKTCFPIAFTFKCCYRGSFYRLMELQWLLVAENKSGVKIDGGEIPWSHYLEGHRKASCGTACKYVAESLQLLWHVPPAFKLADCILGKLVETLFLLECPISLAQPGCAGSSLGRQEWLSYWHQAAKKLLPLTDELRSWAKAMWTKEISGED